MFVSDVGRNGEEGYDGLSRRYVIAVGNRIRG